MKGNEGIYSVNEGWIHTLAVKNINYEESKLIVRGIGSLIIYQYEGSFAKTIPLNNYKRSYPVKHIFNDMMYVQFTDGAAAQYPNNRGYKISRTPAGDIYFT